MINFAEMDAGRPDDFFQLSSMLYNRVDEFSPSDRQRLFPLLMDIVKRFEDCPALRNIIKSIQRFIDEELQLEKAQFEEMEIDSNINDVDDGFHEDLFVLPLRKGSPLRFDGLSIVTECDDETMYDEVTSYTDELESEQRHDFAESSVDDGMVDDSGLKPTSDHSDLSLDDVKNMSNPSHKKSVKKSVSRLVRRVSAVIRHVFS